MKTLIAALLFTVVAQAQMSTHANGALQLNCVVPLEGGTPAIKLVIEAVEESQGDFMTVLISEPQQELLYFNQLEKGAFRAGLTEGQLITLVVGEGVELDNGVIRNAGFLVLSKEASGFQGFLSVNNSFYPLVCM
jgi:hypothetical protein